MTDEVNHLKSKVTEWCENLRTKGFSKKETWHSFQSSIMRTLQYPLLATCMIKKEINKIMSPLLQTVLSRAGICKTISRDIVYSSLEHKGLNVADLWVQQGLLKLIELIGADSDTDTSSLFKDSYYTCSLECGLGPNFMTTEYTPMLGSITTKGIIQVLWQFCSEHKIDITSSNPPRCHYPNDAYLMERVLQLELDPKCFRQFNMCR